ncbi:MAG TPA: DinB family protein [Acidimicrobiales bacterium]|nr:DinB family protein [Acidimicrobiales bacterium]
MSGERDWFQVVAEQECQECALEARAVAQGALGAAISEEGHRWGALLTERHGVDVLRRRPGADVWSAIEYAAHVRDVLALFRDRVALVLSEHEPEFGWWDHEAAAVHECYNDQDPQEVSAALATNAAGLARALPSPGDTAWDRAGTRRGRERFTVEGLARFALHEARHHRIDAERGCG